MVKNAALFGAPLASVVDGSADNMLDEASISRAMRRPGKVVFGAGQRGPRIGQREDEERQAGQREQQRAVARQRRARPAGVLTSAGSADPVMAGLRLPNERITMKIAASADQDHERSAAPSVLSE